MRIIESKEVKTRLEHECVGCLRLMPKGTKMNVVTFEDGFITHDYWCPVCQEMFEQLSPNWVDNTISPGDMKNGDPQHWEKIRKEIEDEQKG